MAKYRKKPVVVDAVQWFKAGDHKDVLDIPDKMRDFIPVINGAKGIIGDYFVFPGDWIFTDMTGEVYLCKPDIFEMTFEAVL